MWYVCIEIILIFFCFFSSKIKERTSKSREKQYHDKWVDWSWDGTNDGVSLEAITIRNQSILQMFKFNLRFLHSRARTRTPRYPWILQIRNNLKPWEFRASWRCWSIPSLRKAHWIIIKVILRWRRIWWERHC